MLRTLVLGAGGPIGAAWLGGLSEGLLQRQVDLRAATQILGTSAGAVLGTWLSSGRPLAEFLAAMRDRASWHAEQPHSTDPGVMARAGRAVGSGHPSEEEVQRVTQDAANAVPPRDIREVAAEWSRWLPDISWPLPLRMVCVDAASGRPRVWDHSDGLTPAAGAATTTAAPGVVAPILLNGRMWVDGCVRSYTNVDLITPSPKFAGRVLVLAPVATSALGAETAAVRGAGADVLTVVPNEQCKALVPDFMAAIRDQAAAAQIADAGRAQGATEADLLRDWWQAKPTR